VGEASGASPAASGKGLRGKQLFRVEHDAGALLTLVGTRHRDKEKKRINQKRRWGKDRMERGQRKK